MRRSAVMLLAWALVVGAGPVMARQAKAIEPATLQGLLPADGPAGFVRQAPKGEADETPGWAA